jgi:glucose-6-phosphate 1-epimerase
MTTERSTQQHDIPGRIAVGKGEGGLARVRITAPGSDADIYLHGAHVTHFQKHGEAPLLFLSRKSRFASDSGIRGGVPICYPWFGARAGLPSHGFARLVEWTLAGASAEPNGSVSVRFVLPRAAAPWDSLETEFVVRVSDRLEMTLATKNGGTQPITLENCLHTYLQVSDIDGVSISGLGGAPFDDFSSGQTGTPRVQDEQTLRIGGETNRVYPDNSAPVEIHDVQLGRVIRVEKSGSRSTVVWNPWTTQKMPDDFDEMDYRQMVCVESGNVKQNAVLLAPGETTRLRVVVSEQR